MSDPLTRSTIQEQQWVARYVMGSLDDAETEAFETYCVAHPEMAEDVALERRMRAGIEVVTRRYTDTRAPARAPMYWAAAATVVLALGGAWLALRRPGVEAPGILLAASASIPASSVARLAELRGAELPTLGEKDDALVRIELAGEFSPEARYRVALAPKDAQSPHVVLASVEGVTPASARSLVVLLDGSQVRAGDYSLTATPDEPGPVLEFDFRKD